MSLSCISEVLELWGLPGHTTNVDAFRFNYLMSHCESVSVLLSYCKVAGFPNRFLWYQGRLAHLQCGLWWEEAAQHSSEGTVETWTYRFSSQKLELINAGNNGRNWVLRSTSNRFSRSICQTQLLGGNMDFLAFSSRFLTMTQTKQEWHGKMRHVFWKNIQADWVLMLCLSVMYSDSLTLGASLPYKGRVLCREFVSWLQAQRWFGPDKSVPKVNALPGRGRDAGMKRNAMPLVLVFLQKLSDVNITFSA